MSRGPEAAAHLNKTPRELPLAQGEGRGLQAYQAQIALGAAGWEGRGLGNGRQKLGKIPEQQTDFIFSVVGEELAHP